MGLWARIVAHHDTAFIDRELATYQVGFGAASETSASLSGNHNWLDRLWTLEALAADDAVAESSPELGMASAALGERHGARRSSWVARTAGDTRSPRTDATC